MKNFRFYLLSLIIGSIALAACVNDDTAETPSTVELVDVNNDLWQPGQNWVDLRDGQEYGTMKIGTTIWMTRNFNYQSTESTYYGPGEKWEEGELIRSRHRVKTDKEQYQLGRLYTWDEANQFAPEGWRLPTTEEWLELKKELRMDGKVYYDISIKPAYYDFNIVSAGKHCKTLGATKLGQAAYFWTADQDDRYIETFKILHREVHLKPSKESAQSRLSIRYVKKQTPFTLSHMAKEVNVATMFTQKQTMDQ